MPFKMERSAVQALVPIWWYYFPRQSLTQGALLLEVTQHTEQSLQSTER